MAVALPVLANGDSSTTLKASAAASSDPGLAVGFEKGEKRGSGAREGDNESCSWGCLLPPAGIGDAGLTCGGRGGGVAGGREKAALWQKSWSRIGRCFTGRRI